MTCQTPITIIGNLNDDPELTTAADGHSVASFTIATAPTAGERLTRTWNGTETLVLRCTIWRHPAEHAAKTLRRGMRVVVFGRLNQQTFQTLDGDTRTLLGCEVDDIGPSLRYATATVDRHHNPPAAPDNEHTTTTADAGASQCQPA